ncbi:MAG TPA: C39 family peptidase [Candidatus Moranbacteria bacterium]|nr:C39 family peptidase [Candidatus Moranbacteria bacterium]
MIKKDKNKISLFSLIFLGILAMAFLTLEKNYTQAESCEDQCKASYPDDEDKQDDCEEDCKKLDKKAEMYESIIKLKDKQESTLAAQVNSINQEKMETHSKLQLTQKELDELTKRIENLEEAIKEKEANINVQKKILTGLMQSYYEYDQQGILGLVIINKDFSETLSQSDYLEQSGAKVSEILSDIEKSKSELENDKKELDEDMQKNLDLKEELADKKADLQYTERQKQNLLTQTQGEEEKYRGLLARVEEQKQELFNFSEAGNLDEVSASVSKYPKPKDNLASTSWYFSQKDSRWGNKKIGNSSSLMKDYGCAVTSVAMVFKKNGASTDPGKMCREKIFYYDLIKWPATWSPGISLSSSVSHGNIKWSTIDSEIKKGNPVIVYIKKTNGRGGHYVVVTGKDKKDYIVHDPYFGSNLYLGTSKSLVGKIGVDSKVAIDQMIIYK